MPGMKTYVLFANCGVQYVYQPIRRSAAAAVNGKGWQRARYRDPATGEVAQWRFIQWQVLGDKFLLAVDTTTGDPRIGYCGSDEGFVNDYSLIVQGLLGPNGEPLPDLPPMEIVIRPLSRAGDRKNVHLVVDFGNSRTCALLMELGGDVSHRLEILPFELLNRYQLDAWRGDQYCPSASARSFSSRTCWCTPPYLAPEEVTFEELDEVPVRGLFRRHYKTVSTSRVERPRLFEDWSMARLGRETDDLLRIMHPEGDLRWGVSSPKRYLWADDSRWLEGANWQMADPFNRSGSRTRADLLHGPLMTFFDSSDTDRLLAAEGVLGAFAAESLPLPQYPPRAMMVAALYELLCQTYSLTNSCWYRSRTGDADRPRQISSLTLTYPSGMIAEERERYRRQAEKAIRIFHATLGSRQPRPALTLSIDEASAVHLTYIWSQLQLLGSDSRLWFDLIANAAHPTAGPALSAAGQASLNGRVRSEPARPGTARSARSEPLTAEARIACIDIGGGSTDLMIARYWCQPGTADVVLGEQLHRDGVSVAGDALVKRLLETAVVPALVRAAGFEPDKVQLLFGPETPLNRAFRAARIGWLNRLLVPLAHRYLDLAVAEDTSTAITHTDPEVVDHEVVDRLQEFVDHQFGAGNYRLDEPLELTYRPADLDAVVHEVLGSLMQDFCSRIVMHRADLVLLAGLPSKLAPIRRLVETLLPLPESRIIGMHGLYAGNWYPYQDDSGQQPGVIVDPKSTVVVGAALDLLARNAMLPQFHFRMQATGIAQATHYYWGTMDHGRRAIRNDRIFLRPDAPIDRVTLEATQPGVLIGRKLYAGEDAEAAPIYILEIQRPREHGEIRVKVQLQRQVDPETHEEVLLLLNAEGMIDGQEAVLGENVHLKWRTIDDQQFFLDTGALDRIELTEGGQRHVLA
jgi:hypothetical protein